MVKIGAGLVVNSTLKKEGEAGVVIVGRGGGILKEMSIGNMLMRVGSSLHIAGPADLRTGTSSHQTCTEDLMAGGQHLHISPSKVQGVGMVPGM